MYQSAMLYSGVGKICTTRKCINSEITVNGFQCHVDEEQQCKKASCVSAVGNFFFGNNGEFRFTRQVFECCEHSDYCFGYPGHVYSPWNCLEKGLSNCNLVFTSALDPFYSCNRVQDECLNDKASPSSKEF